MKIKLDAMKVFSCFLRHWRVGVVSKKCVQAWQTKKFDIRLPFLELILLGETSTIFGSCISAFFWLDKTAAVLTKLIMATNGKDYQFLCLQQREPSFGFCQLHLEFQPIQVLSRPNVYSVLWIFSLQYFWSWESALANLWFNKILPTRMSLSVFFYVSYGAKAT